MSTRPSNTVDRWASRIAEQPFRGAWQGVATVTLGIAILGGILVRLTDPSQFHSIWVGMWWGMETVTTVGYGDVVPHTAAGRLTGVLVMLVGISFITVTIAAITSEFVEAGRRRRLGERESAELREIRALRDEIVALQRQTSTLQAQVTGLRGEGGPA